METNCLAFTGFDSDCDIDEFQTYLHKFGHVLYFMINQTRVRGYVVYEEKESAIRCLQNMNAQNGHNFGVSFSICYCSIDEVNSAVTLSNSKYKEVDLSDPSTNRNVFRITKAQPPIFWQLNHQ